MFSHLRTPTTADRKHRKELNPLGLQCLFRCNFVIADVAMPIIIWNQFRGQGPSLLFDTPPSVSKFFSSYTKGKPCIAADLLIYSDRLQDLLPAPKKEF